MDLTEKVNPFNFAKIFNLIQVGQHIQQNEKNKNISIKKDTGKRYQVTIPLIRFFRIINMLCMKHQTTAAAEGKSIKTMLLFFIKSKCRYFKNPLR